MCGSEAEDANTKIYSTHSEKKMKSERVREDENRNNGCSLP